MFTHFDLSVSIHLETALSKSGEAVCDTVFPREPPMRMRHVTDAGVGWKRGAMAETDAHVLYDSVREDLIRTIHCTDKRFSKYF